LPVESSNLGINNVIANEMDASKAVGMAYASINGNDIIEIGANGLLDKRQENRVNAESLFILGSVSKSFTALAIMQLVESGQLELDKPFSQILQNFVDTPLENVTVRQLLSHTSGLSTLQGNQSQTDYTLDAAALSRRVNSLVRISPTKQPGSVWSYSNANYQILGRLIEVVSGMDYAMYIEQKVLKPVGMHDSFVFKGRLRDNMAVGHRPWFGTKRALRKNRTGLGSGPQGGIVSNVKDMALYMRMMLNRKDDVISAAGKKQMMAPANRVSPNYGFGWFINLEKSTVFHSGSNPGYEALVTMHPKRQEAAVVLVNSGSGYGFGETRQLRYGLSAAALNIPYGGEADTSSKKATFIFLVILPFMLFFGMFLSWQKRKNSKSRSTFLSKVGLIVPLFLALAIAWVLLIIVPAMFGATFGAANVFQPDMGLLLASISVLAAFWSSLRIYLALTK